MDVIVAILLAGGIISIGTHLIRRHKRRGEAEREQSEATQRSLDTIQVDDVIVYQRKDLIVEAVAELAEGNTRWQVCRLLDGQERHVLRLARDTEQIFIGRQIEQLVSTGEPPESLDHDGEIFTLRKCGQAVVVSSQPPGSLSGGWDYWEYWRAGHDRLWLQRCGGELIFYRGEQTGRHMIDYLPA